MLSNESLDAINNICTAIYAIEAAMKITFYGKEYFTYIWNIFDFSAVAGIITFQIIFAIIDVENNPVSVILTIFRVFKLLSLFRLLKALRRTLQTITLALPSAVNIALLVILVNYIFAVIGVGLFAETKLQKYLEHHANFQNLLSGFLTAFRLVTGDNWCVVMHDLIRGKSPDFDCVSFPSFDDIHLNQGHANGCGGAEAAVYCILLVLVVNFVFLNLFVAIIVTSMLEISELSESVLSDEVLDKFQQTWSKYDPDALGLMEYSDVRKFLCELGEPLGVSNAEMPNRYYSALTLWMLELKIYYYSTSPIYYLEFYDVLEALVKRSIYRPQTLHKIFNNTSKNELVDGLKELWAEKSKLIIDEQENLGNVEALNFYYTEKKNRAKGGINCLKKAQLPLMVWFTLRITKTLKQNVLKRKGLKLMEASMDKSERQEIKSKTADGEVAAEDDENSKYLEDHKEAEEIKADNKGHKKAMRVAVPPLATSAIKEIKVEEKESPDPGSQSRRSTKSRIFFAGGDGHGATAIEPKLPPSNDTRKMNPQPNAGTTSCIAATTKKLDEAMPNRRLVGHKLPHIVPKVAITNLSGNLVFGQKSPAKNIPPKSKSGTKALPESIPEEAHHAAGRSVDDGDEIMVKVKKGTREDDDKTDEGSLSNRKLLGGPKHEIGHLGKKAFEESPKAKLPSLENLAKKHGNN